MLLTSVIIKIQGGIHRDHHQSILVEFRVALRFVITSRIEEHIRRKLETSAANSPFSPSPPLLSLLSLLSLFIPVRNVWMLEES